MNRRQSLVAALALTLTLGACGGSATSSSGSGNQGDGSSSGEAQDSSPLGNLLGTNDSPAEQRRKQIKVEELTSACMREKGWEYTAVDYEAQFSSFNNGEDADLSPEEYGKKYMYGITRSYELYELPSLEGQPAEGDQPAEPDVPVDPNSKYVESLSEPERQQYYEDLTGPQTEPSIAEDGSFTPPPPEQRGCSGIAGLRVYGKSPFDDPDISQRLQEIFQQVEDDPRLKKANQSWQACVREIDASFELARPGDAYTLLEKTKAELAGQEIVPLDPTTGEPVGGGDVWNTFPDENGNGFAALGQPSPISGDKLEQLRSEEKRIWDADQKCQKKAKITDIRKQVEQDMADQIVQEFPQLDKSGGNG